MISAALILPLLGLLLGSLLGWGGMSLVRWFAKRRHEAWFVAGSAVLLLLLLLVTCGLGFMVGMIITTGRIGLSASEYAGYLLCVCAFDAGALAGVLSTLLAEVSRRRQEQGGTGLALFSRAFFSASAWGLD